MKRTLTLISVLLLITLLLASCKSASSNGDYVQNRYPSDENAGMSTNPKDPKPDYDSSAKPDEGEFERKIIYTSNISAETKDFDRAIAEIESMVQKFGGYVQSSQTTGNRYLGNGEKVKGARSATYTIRVPADNYESFLSEFGGLVNVTDSQRTSEDITTKYYDIKTRLKTLEAERDSLTKMLAEATDLDYILKVQSKLYDVIYEIESYTTTLKQYELLTSYATVNLRLYEVLEYTPTTEEKGYFARLWESFKDGWVDFGAWCADFSIDFVGAIPTLLLLALIVFIVIVIVRKSIKAKKNKAKKDE